MCLKICSLSSGSKGNSVFISTGNTKILVDNGMPVSYIEKALTEIGESPAELDAILVTHRHSDHISGVGGFSKKYSTKVYAYYTECGYLSDEPDNYPRDLFSKKDRFAPAVRVPYNNIIDFFDGDFYLKDLTVSPFRVSHDVFCLGYSFYHKGHKISVVTDVGRVDGVMMSNLADSDIVMIESNHDKTLLRQNDKYSPWLKKRISGSGGHLSNNDCAEASAALAGGGTKNIILAHLSEENNYPELAFETVSGRLREYGIIEGKDVQLNIAKQHTRTSVFRAG